jgi:ABC-type lipoprotein release transport system permease subunit
MLLKLAWRNIFRNKRRSLITVSSVIFAVVFAVFMRSLQYGAYDNMLKNIVGSYLGYIQVHQKGFWAEKTLDNSFEPSDIASLLQNKNISSLSYHIDGFALASIGDNAKPVALLGIDERKHPTKTGLQQHIVSGSFFDKDHHGVIAGVGLRDIMNLKIGDSLVFISQGFQGSMASGSYPIIAFIDLKTPELNKRTVLMELEQAQEFFGMPDRVTTAIVGLHTDAWEATQTQIQSSVDTTQIEVMNWQQMLPELQQLIAVDKAGGLFVLLILYTIITFSLFGTVLMLTEERSFEYGVLISIGMARSKVIAVAILETILMAFAGILAGLIIVFPIVWYFHIHPINLSGQMQEVVEKFGFEALIPTSLDPTISLSHAAIIFGIVLLVNMYTVLKIKKLHPINAMKR